MANRVIELKALVDIAEYVHAKLGAIQWPEGTETSIAAAQARCVKLSEALRLCIASTMISEDQ